MGISGIEQKIAVLRVPMTFTYYIKFSSTGAHRQIFPHGTRSSRRDNKARQISGKRTFLTTWYANLRTCIMGGRNVRFFAKFDVLCFLVTPVLRFALLPYCRQRLKCSVMINSLSIYWEYPRAIWKLLDQYWTHIFWVPKLKVCLHQCHWQKKFVLSYDKS